MKITVGKLRKLISEVAISPSLKQNKPVDDPLTNKNINVSLEKLQAAFEQALATDMIVRAMDRHYNEETREFDDDVYEHIKELVNQARDRASSITKKGLQSAWQEAHQESDGAKSGHRLKAA